MNKCIDFKCVQKPTKEEPAYTNTRCKQIQPLSRVKTLNGPRVSGNSPVGKEKVYGGKDLLKSQVLSSEYNTERVREDASGDSEDDELPCVIGESEGDCNEAREHQLGVRSTDKVLHTEKSNHNRVPCKLQSYCSWQ